MYELAVRIYWGTADGALSRTPLVSVGALGDDYDPVSPTLVKDDQVWMLVNGIHCNMCASYVRAKTLKDEQPFQLLICLFIPVGQRLADERSPLEVLDALGKKFDDWFGTSRGLIYFNQSKANAIMKRVLANYPLEECPFYVFQMEGVQPGAFRVESISQLSALMRYSNYYPIAQINCLEMSFKCKSTIDINTKGESGDNAKKEKWQWWWKREKPLENFQPKQPKPQSQETFAPTKQQESHVSTENTPVQHKGYQVLVNGEAQNVYLRWDDDDYYLRWESTEDYRYESLHFKLGELKSAPKRRVATLSGRTVAQLDEKNGCINCEMKPAERWLRKEISFTTDSDVEARKFVKYHPDKLQVLIGREPWNDDKIKPSVAKKAVEKNNIRIAPKEVEGYSFSFASAKIAKDRLIITIEAKHKADKINKRNPTDIHRESIVYPKSINEELGKGKAVPTRRSMPNWVAEVKVWHILHPVLFKATIACAVLLAIVTAILINRSNEKREDRLRYEKQVALELAAYQQCTTADLCRQYLKEKPYGFYREQVDSLLNVFVQDSIAEMERDPEKAAYYMCLRTDVVVAYNACMEYLVSYERGRYEADVTALRKKIQDAYDAKDLELYNKCLREDVGLYARKQACDLYKNSFKYGKFNKKVDALKSVIGSKLEKGKKEKLKQLNKGDLAAFGDNSEGCLDSLDYLTALWMLKGCNTLDELFIHKQHLLWRFRLNDGKLGVHYKKISEGPLIFTNSDELKMAKASIEIAVIRPFRDGKGFRFKDWEQVSTIYERVVVILVKAIDNFNRLQDTAKLNAERERKMQRY